ncbi:Histone-lysine N-methyltransferase SETMAR [Ooceraea biroi]|uniref:Histone-lysine N-methyltransferase SETMAR n=1 Tax=Ooceraea biroi TaxID=2015173 RepID=A0A026WJT7_OOCBI|nr:Histone-lysine N-methyltransferase SETMAR [Ooceraea biroi]
MENQKEHFRHILFYYFRKGKNAVPENLNISKSSVENHLKRLGYISKLDIWVAHELKEIHLTKRIDICDSLLKREENDRFLKRITGDEKWIVYSNVKRKRWWSKRDEPAEST